MSEEQLRSEYARKQRHLDLNRLRNHHATLRVVDEEGTLDCFNTTILFTIRKPTSADFNSFRNVCICDEGQLAYYG